MTRVTRGLLALVLVGSPCPACTFFLRVDDDDTTTGSTGTPESTGDGGTTAVQDCAPRSYEAEPTEGEPIPETEGDAPLCVPLDVVVGCDDTVTSIELTIRAQHTNFGDLSARLYPPGTMAPMDAGFAVFDRPGRTGDDTEGVESNLDPAYALVVTDASDAPTMTDLLSCWDQNAEEVCSPDFMKGMVPTIDCAALVKRCRVAAPGLAALVGTLTGGTWHFCIEDRSALIVGDLFVVELTLNGRSSARAAMGAFD